MTLYGVEIKNLCKQNIIDVCQGVDVCQEVIIAVKTKLMARVSKQGDV